MMNFLGNVIWFLFAGLWQGIGWLVAGLLWSVTIVGIPVGRQCFKLGRAVVLSLRSGCGARRWCPFLSDERHLAAGERPVAGPCRRHQRLAPVPDGGGYSLRHAVLQAGSAVAVAIWRAHRLPIKRRRGFLPGSRAAFLIPGGSCPAPAAWPTSARLHRPSGSSAGAPEGAWAVRPGRFFCSSWRRPYRFPCCRAALL